jgi:hypothetical protein
MESHNGQMNKIHKNVFIGIIIFTIFITSTLVFIIMPRGKPVEPQEWEMLFESVKEGDIICRLGDRLWSQYFRDISIEDKRYSHMGIIQINNNQVTVIHAEGTTKTGRDFVKEERLNDFIKAARSIGIYRINNFDNGNKIANLAIEYLNTPFDWQFDMNNDTKIYCTELLYVILKRVLPETKLKTIYIKELGKDIIPLDAISNSEYFSEIYWTCSTIP